MSIFVTGGAGFVGANVVRRLVDLDEEVHLLIRSTSDVWRLHDMRHRLNLHEGDLNDSNSLMPLLSRIHPTVVYHFGTHGAYHYQQDTERILQTAVLGTWNLLRASMAAGATLFLNAGTSSEYGTKDRPMNEDDALAPNTHYAVGKAAQTYLCQQAAREGLPTITLRLFSVYGPYEEPGRLVPTLIGRALRGEDLELADPNTARDFIYIDDVVSAFIEASKRQDLAGQVVNLGSGRQSTLRDMVDAILSITNSASRPLWGRYGARSFDTTVWVADDAKMRRELRFQPEIDLREGLTRYIKWYKEHAERYERDPR